MSLRLLHLKLVLHTYLKQHKSIEFRHVQIDDLNLAENNK